MLTYSPLPSWRNVLRAVSRSPLPPEALAASWSGEGELAGWLSRSAWSLALIAQWRMAATGKTRVTIWIPDYFCNGSLVPLRGTGAQIVFYPVDAELNPQVAAFKDLAATQPPDVFVAVHYFGRPASVAPSRDFCIRQSCWLVEDAAQVLRPVAGVGNFGDFVIYSPHKLLPAPDGAVLIARSEGPAHLAPPALTAFGDPRSWATQLLSLDRNLRASGALKSESALGWLAKRLLQNSGVGTGARSVGAYDEETAPRDSAPQPLSSPRQSGLSRRLLSTLVKSLPEAARARRRAQLVWDEILLNEEQNVTSTSAGCEYREWTPYLASYSAADGSAAKLYERWQARGIPVTSWPDLPPEVTAARDSHGTAWRLRHERVYVPVHQTLGDSPLAVARRGTRPALAGRFAVEGAGREEWESWMNRAGRSSLLQSWSYGDAKAGTSGWTVVRRPIEIGGEQVAFVQMLLIKRGWLRITRINRGPLFLRPPSREELRAAWKAIGSLGNARRGRFLSVAPELELSGASLVMMRELGFRRRDSAGYESSWLDIGNDDETLRSRLDVKWRNKLKLSEKAGLTMESGEGDELFRWMLDKYGELKTERNFEGPPLALLERLRKSSAGNEKVIVLRATAEGEPCAGLCVATHGSSATYLLGWNGPQGRRLRANQFLVWQAISLLRDAGVRWLDVGGFSERDTPGVMTFKLGLNGERYELVGEYVKW